MGVDIFFRRRYAKLYIRARSKVSRDFLVLLLFLLLSEMLGQFCTTLRSPRLAPRGPLKKNPRIIIPA